MWLRYEKFKEVVREYWLEMPADSPIMDNLKHCMSRLASWSSKEFGKVGKKVNDLKTQIQNLRKGPRTEDTMAAESRLSSELDEWLEREELWWKQRSRAEWLKNGDRNTSYFHAKASQRKKRNRIERLKNNIEELTESESEIASIITSYFTNIFQSQVITQDDTWSRNLALVPKLVTEEMNNILMAPFSEGEVRRALSQMHPTKAPGLDGFSALFYQSNWSVAKQDSVDWVSEILSRYEKISGQKVNYAKSEMVCLRNKFVEKLHLKAVDSHSKYLGLPLSFGNRKTWLFREIEEKEDQDRHMHGRGISESLYILKHGAEWVEEEEKYIWCKGGSSTFTVKEAYKIADELDNLKKASEGSNQIQEKRNGSGRTKMNYHMEPNIFCDGYFDPVKRRGGAGVILTSGKAINGVRASFMVNCGSAFEAELMALNLGMEMALEHNLSKVKFFTDSKEVLWAFNLGSWRPDVESSVINKGIKVFDDHPGWILGAILRDSNVAADQIARKARIDLWQWSNSLAIPRCIAEVA
ncbi:hypothetical protein QQ045_000718 [Rhodiola kirilowii]